MQHFLDYAATSAVRPRAVIDAVVAFLEESGATPGRGGYERSLDAGRMVLQARRAICRILGVSGDPGRMAFTANATVAMNTALRGLLPEGSVVVLTAADHNSVLRPVEALRRERGVEVRLIDCDAEGELDFDALGKALEGATLLSATEVSNVTGARLPVTRMAEMAREAGALTLVDAAQALGHVEVDYGSTEADVVVWTGHKGLMGPQGSGGLWVRPGIELPAFLLGGSGGNSVSRDMPDVMPDRLEGGTSNVPAIAGLLAGCRYLSDAGPGSVIEHERSLRDRLRHGLEEISGVEVLSSRRSGSAGIVTFRCPEVAAGTVAERLATGWGIASRAGLHCAPEMHRVLGTLETGAVRLSVGWASSVEDVQAAIEAVGSVCGNS